MRLGRLNNNNYECAVLSIPACDGCPATHMDLPLYDEVVVPNGVEFNDWGACMSSSASSDINDWYLDVFMKSSPQNKWVCVQPLDAAPPGGNDGSSSSSSSSSSGPYVPLQTEDCTCIRYQDYDPATQRICGDIYLGEQECKSNKCRSDMVLFLEFEQEAVVDSCLESTQVEHDYGCNTVQSAKGLYSGYLDGSFYLDPSGDLSLGSGNFDVEFCVRLDEDQEVFFLDCRRFGDSDTQNKPSLYMGASYRPESSSSSQVPSMGLHWMVDGESLISAPALTPKIWHCVAVRRDFGVTRMFVDGNQVGSDLEDRREYLGNPTLFGSTFEAHQSFMTGYADEVLIRTKTAGSTIALMHFDGDFSDSSGAGVLFGPEVNATLSQATRKFGSSGASFDGNSSVSFLVPNNTFGAEDFTVEMWFKAESPGSGAQYATLASCQPHGFALYYNHYGAGSGYISFVTDHFQIVSSNAFLDSRWHHVAAVRAGDMFSLYVDGNIEASASVPGVLINT